MIHERSTEVAVNERPTGVKVAAAEGAENAVAAARAMPSMIVRMDKFT